MKTELRVADDGSKAVVTINSQGQEVHVADYRPDGDFAGEVIYSYDSLGRCDAWTVYKSDAAFPQQPTSAPAATSATVNSATQPASISPVPASTSTGETKQN